MKFTPIASALISTSPGPGEGCSLSTCVRTSGPPVSATSIAFMVTSLPRVKLARPDVFHPRIVLAGCAALPEGGGDDGGLGAALRNPGLQARRPPLDDQGALDPALGTLLPASASNHLPRAVLAW